MHQACFKQAKSMHLQDTWISAVGRGFITCLWVTTKGSSTSSTEGWVGWVGCLYLPKPGVSVHKIDANLQLLISPTQIIKVSIETELICFCVIFTPFYPFFHFPFWSSFLLPSFVDYSCSTDSGLPHLLISNRPTFHRVAAPSTAPSNAGHGDRSRDDETWEEKTCLGPKWCELGVIDSIEKTEITSTNYDDHMK